MRDYGKITGMKNFLEQICIFKAFEEAGLEGQGIIPDLEMHPIKAYVRGDFCTLVGHVGQKKDKLSLFCGYFLAALNETYLAAGYVYDLVGAFGALRVYPFSFGMKEPCVAEFEILIYQTVQVVYSYLMSLILY